MCGRSRRQPRQPSRDPFPGLRTRATPSFQSNPASGSDRFESRSRGLVPGSPRAGGPRGSSPSSSEPHRSPPRAARIIAPGRDLATWDLKRQRVSHSGITQGRRNPDPPKPERPEANPSPPRGSDVGSLVSICRRAGDPRSRPQSGTSLRWARIAAPVRIPVKKRSSSRFSFGAWFASSAFAYGTTNEGIPRILVKT